MRLPGVHSKFRYGNSRELEESSLYIWVIRYKRGSARVSYKTVVILTPIIRNQATLNPIDEPRLPYPLQAFH